MGTGKVENSKVQVWPACVSMDLVLLRVLQEAITALLSLSLHVMASGLALWGDTVERWDEKRRTCIFFCVMPIIASLKCRLMLPVPMSVGSGVPLLFFLSKEPFLTILCQVIPLHKL